MIPDFNLLSARLSLIQRIPNPSHNTTVAGSLSFAILSGWKSYCQPRDRSDQNARRLAMERLMVREGLLARFFRNGKARSPDWAALLGLNRRAGAE